MPNKNDLKKLRKQEKELLDAIAVSVANLDRLNDDQRRDLKKRDKADEREQVKKLNRQIRDRKKKLVAVRKRLEKRRGRVRKLTDRIRKLARALARPRIIDLDLDFRPMDTQTTVDKVIGHYTAGPKDRDTKDAIRLCRLYHQAHLNQGWSGEAYMLCFTVDGDILVLRPARYVGAHTLGFNTGSYGVMCHGTTGDTPSRAQKRAMRWWANNGHKPRMGKAQTQKRPGLYPWKVHKDFNATACPGSFTDTYRNKGN